LTASFKTKFLTRLKMPHNYTPKTDGETLLRYQVARVRARVSKLEKEGKEYNSPIVSIPYDQAVELVDRAKARKGKLETASNIAGELSFQLDDEYVNYNVSTLRNLANKLLVALSQVK
jgi:hypothetical protein